MILDTKHVTNNVSIKLNNDMNSYKTLNSKSFFNLIKNVGFCEWQSTIFVETLSITKYLIFQIYLMDNIISLKKFLDEDEGKRRFQLWLKFIIY